MSNSVVPAAAVAHAKQLVRNKKLTKRTEDQKPAQDEHQAADKDADTAHVVQADQAEGHQASMSDTTLSGNFSFVGALSAAATSSASLAAEVAQDDGGSMSDDDGGAGGTILLVGAVGLVGLGIAVLADGGGGKSNDPPAFAADSQAVTTNEDTPVTVTVSASDPDGDALSYSVTTNPTKGTVTAGANGAFTYTPNADVNGADSFVVTVNDGNGGTDTITVNVTITPVDDAPRPGADNTSSLTIDEDTSGVVVVDFSDPEGNEPLTFAVTQGPANGTFTLVGDDNVYTPNADFNGEDSITYTVTDSNGNATTFTVDITVNPVNDDPTVDATQTVGTSEETAVVVTVEGDDVDGDELSYSIGDDDGPANGTVTEGDEGVFTYTPDEGFTGSDSFTVTVDDGNGGTATQVVTVNVGPQIEDFSLDIVGENSTTPRPVDASVDMFRFLDDAGKDTDVAISGFSDDDVIVVSGATAADYNFGTGSDANDLFITFVNPDNGASNLILIDDILAGSSTFITDYASAVEAVGFDFMTFA